MRLAWNTRSYCFYLMPTYLLFSLCHWRWFFLCILKPKSSLPFNFRRMAPALLSKDKKQRPKVASHFKLAEVNMEALNDPLPPHHPGSPKALMIPSLALETLPSEGGQFRPFRNYGEEDRAVTSPAATISNYTSVQSGLMQKETIYYPHVTNGWYNFGLIDTLNALLFA